MAAPDPPASAGTAVWVVLPTYEEADNLGEVVARLRRVLDAAGESHRILIVDDASPDGTGVVADRLAAEHSEVLVLHRRAKAGIGAAYAAGFDVALQHGAGLVVQMDADLSHDPADVPRLLAVARAGADVVIGSRYVAGGGVQGWPAWRRLLSRFGSYYARSMLDSNVHDLTGGFKCFRRAALKRIEHGGARTRGYAFQVELTHRAVAADLRVVEIPIVFRERRHGRSKMSPAIALEAAWAVPRLRRGHARRRSVTTAGAWLRSVRRRLSSGRWRDRSGACAGWPGRPKSGRRARR